MVVTDKTNLYPPVLFVQVLLVCHCVNSTPSTARSTHSDLCGPSDVVLHSETLLTFPVSVDHSLLNLLLRSPPSYPLEIKHVADATHKVNGVTSDAVYYNCTWVVRADQGCAVSAIIDFDNVNGYDFSVADHVDVIKNCSSKHCTFHSTTPVVSIRFRTKRVDSAPAARFVARLYSTRPPKAKATCVEPWLVVSTILVSAALFSSVAYLFYMKRKLLLARIFKLWSSGEPSPKPKKSSVSISSYPFGDLNRQRTLSSASTPYPHFEPMPTITEEENEVSSDYGGDENQASPDQTSTVHSAPIC